MYVHKGTRVSATILVHFYGWQSIISAGLLLNSKEMSFTRLFLLGLRMYSSFGACVSIIINPVGTAQLNRKIV